MNTIDIVVEQYTNEEKMNKLHIEREQTMQLAEFQKWLKEMHIGSRCEVKNHNAIDMMQDYDWSKWNEQKQSRMPEFIQRWF